MSDTVLEFQNVWKKFQKGEKFDSLRDVIPALFKKALKNTSGENLGEQEFWALHDVSFSIPRGRALAIIGPNGSGKSTTLKLLSGILRPTKGNIRVNGRLSALIEVGAGFHQDLTGRENIYLNGAILGMKKDEIDRKLDEIIDFSGISEFIDTPVKRYSSGMYARLGFSIAAHVDPEILLVDEVLSVGDYTFQGRCIKKMEEILKNGTTVIFVSHNMDSVLSLCDDALLLNRGKIIHSGTPSEVITIYYDIGGEWEPKYCTDKKAKINKIYINGVDSLDKAIKPGTRLSITVEIDCAESCFVSPGVFITQQGNVVFDTTYSRMTGNIVKLDKTHKTKVCWDISLNLPPGVYDLGFHLEDVKSNGFQDYIARYRKIIIAEDNRTVSKYFLEPNVNIINNSNNN